MNLVHGTHCNTALKGTKRDFQRRMTFISKKHHRAKPNRSLPLGEFAFMLQGHCVPGLSVGLDMNEYFNSTISFCSVISHNGIPKDFKTLFL